MARFERHLFVCTNVRPDGDARGSCGARGGKAIAEALKARCKELGLKGEVRINQAGCLDRCAEGPVVVAYPEQAWYAHVTLEDVDELAIRQARDGERVERLLATVKPKAGDTVDSLTLAARHELLRAEVLRRALGLEALSLVDRRRFASQLDSAMARVEELAARSRALDPSSLAPSLSAEELSTLPNVTSAADAVAAAARVGIP